jgi:hypothetical protein
MMDTDFVSDVHLIYQDNQSTIAMVKKLDGKPKTKYMKARQQYVHECLSTAEVEIKYIRTSEMLGEVFTKAFGVNISMN